jgi:hypothetical protein
MINKSITIDTTKIITDLCNISSKYRSDKCPYVTNPYPESNSVHPYTAIYDSLFKHMRNKTINIAEIGIAYNDSINIWRKYFPFAKIYGFDVNENFIINAKKQKLLNTIYEIINVCSDVSIDHAFKKNNVKYDIIIDDSTHYGEDQIRIIKKSVNYLKNNGILVIEDIHRAQNEQDYVKEFKSSEICSYFSSATFIKTEHNKRKFGSSVDWPYYNDKLLILVRNDNNQSTLDPNFLKFIDYK